MRARKHATAGVITLRSTWGETRIMSIVHRRQAATCATGRRIDFRRSAVAVALSVALAGVCATTVAPAFAQAPASTRHAYVIPAGSLKDALDALASQAGVSVLFSPDLVTGKRTRGVSGQFTPAEALGRLLEGTDVGFESPDPTTLVLRRKPAASAAPAVQGVAPRRAPAAAQASEADVQELGQLTVTGTRIRGGTTPSPVTTIGIQQIQEEGFSDLGEVIRSVPQNFSGGQNPGVLMGNVIGAGLANQNLTGGSALNLRGLGPDASLTLLNGRRMSYGGFVQAVDISAVPVEAVARVEIVADGASAIYGSDAVGGVGNVILKRDFDGVAISAAYGAATDGGLAKREYAATAGGHWGSGGLIATYKHVSTDPLYARQRDYTDHLPEPQMLLPESSLRSGLVSAHQALGDVVELRLDALRTERDQRYYYFGASPALYNILTPETSISLVSPGVDVFLPNDWTLSLSSTWGKDEHVQEHARFTFATGAVTPMINDCMCNKSRIHEIGAEGPLFAMPGGDARIAVGAGYRQNAFLQFNYLTGANTIQGDESSRFAYAEANFPLVGPEAGRAGVRRLNLIAAVRGEDYDSFGRVTTPKLGLVYGPGADYTLKASWGRSFKAPTLYQLFRARIAQVSSAASFGGAAYPANALVLIEGGGNRTLDPERARVLTASFAFHPEAIPGLEAELTWFDIEYTDRVIEPFTNFAQALSNPAFAEFVQLAPSAAEQAEIIARADRYVVGGGLTYDPARVVAILHARYINAVRQEIRGVDLSGSYRFELDAGQLTLRGSASWLDSVQQTTVTAFDLAGTLHNPVKFSGRLGTVWTRGGFTASAFANHKSGVRNVVQNEELASFTTFDATLRYALARSGGAWAGLEVALSAQNLFDRAPSLYTLAADRTHVPPYDSTNYSPIGRFLNLSISKHW